MGYTDFLVRLTATGTLDPAFQNAGPYPSGALQVQADGKVLVSALGGGGRSGPTTGGIVRLLADGGIDPAFQVPPASTGVSSVQVLANGQLLLGGGPAYYPGATSALGAVLLNADGSRDLGFAPHLQDVGEVKDLAIQADSKLLIGGLFDEVNGHVAHGLTRLNSDGTSDAAYSPGTMVGTAVYALALQTDGKLLVGGNFTSLGSSPRPGIARILPAGTVDPGFVPPLPATLAPVQRIAIQPDGQVLLTGPDGLGFRRLSATGQPDPSFQPPATCYPRALLVQPDGRIIVGGSYFVNSASYPLVRLLADGNPDPSFIRQNAVGVVPLALAQYPDGRLLVGGTFTRYGAMTSAGVLRLLPNGLADNSFSASLTASDVYSLAIQPNQRIFIGGLLNTGNPATRQPCWVPLACWTTGPLMQAIHQY